MVNHDQAAEKNSLPRVPTKSAGGSGCGAGGETGAAEPRRPQGLSSLKKEDPSPERRERCPVCSCAVWGLSVRARQVHINSCLDVTAAGASGAVTGGEGHRSAGGGVAAPAGRRSSSGAAAAVAKEPKTEYQEHIQMAKALSKSLVEPTRAAAAEQEEETDEDLARNPAAFRAKEKRLVRALKNLDSKLERLHKDRHAALRKLAAHRALGARASATVSAGAGISGDNNGGGDGGVGGGPKTAEEVVDIIFPEEHAVTTTNRPSTRSEGWRQRREEAKLSAEAAAAAAEVGTGSASPANADADARPRTSRWGEGLAGAPGGPVGATKRVDNAAARGAPPCAGDGKDTHDSGGDGIGGARLLRRRSSGGADGVSGAGNEPLFSSAASKSEKGKSRRTFWGIAQDADELSQSNFVTGVFADIRAECAATAAGEKPMPKVGTAAAAPYGDASLYRRVRPARPASRSAEAGAKATAASVPTPNLGSGLGGTRARGTATAAVCDGNGSSAAGVGETRAPGGERSDLDDGEGGDSDGAESVDAVDGAILLLSQTLSAGRQPRPSSAVRVPPQRPKLSALDTPRSDGAASASEDVRKDDEGKEEGGEEVEAARVAARHIAHAPVDAISRLFPKWKENVRFVFRQGTEELRKALKSVDAALSEEEAAVAGAANASAGREDALGGDSGRRGGSPVARGSKKHPGCSGGGKAEALLFFQGVILEALDLKGPAAPSQHGSPPPRRHGEGDDDNRGGGGSRSSGAPERVETTSRRADEGDEKVAGDASNDASHVRDTEHAGGEKEGDATVKSRRDAAGGGGGGAGVSAHGLGVPGVKPTAEEAVDVDSREVFNDISSDVASLAGEAGDRETERGRGGDLRDRDSVETIVLSGDSCCDAVVTFDFTSSEPVKNSPRTASPDAAAAVAAAADVLTGSPSGAGEPPHCDEADGNGGIGRPHRDTILSVGKAKDGADDGDDDDDFAIMGNGGDSKSGSHAKESGATCDGVKAASDDDGLVFDEYPGGDEDGFVDDYCPLDDQDNLSVFLSPGDGGAPDERFGLPSSSPLSRTQLRSPQASPKQGAGDDRGGGGGGSGKASCDASAKDAEVLDLTQVAPSPVPPAKPHRGEGKESNASPAARAEAPVRNRPPHRSRETSSARRHRDDAASPPIGMEEEEEEEQAATAPIHELDAGVQMTLQELAGMMALYGLKKKSKREMTQRLEHIWKTLHPAAAAAAAREEASTAGHRDTTASSTASASRKRRAAGAGRANGASTAASAGSQGRPPLARPARGTVNGGGSGAGRGGASSQRPTRALGGKQYENYEEDEDDDDERTTAVPLRPPLSSQNKRSHAASSDGEEEATSSLAARVRAVITGFAPLHEDILLLRTIELSATQRLLKDKGVKCSKKDLASYLDARGITFVDRDTRRGGERPQKKKKKPATVQRCARDPRVPSRDQASDE
eukprot:g9876.t1